MPEEILTDDKLARRFQYKLLLPVVKEHVSTLDVHDLGIEFHDAIRKPGHRGDSFTKLTHPHEAGGAG